MENGAIYRFSRTFDDVGCTSPGQRERLHNKIADLFEHRHLFVQHDVTPAEQRTLQKITRGLPQLRTLRDLMEEITEVHVEFSTNGTPMSCKLKLVGEAVRELSGEEITAQVVAFL